MFTINTNWALKRYVSIAEKMIFSGTKSLSSSELRDLSWIYLKKQAPLDGSFPRMNHIQDLLSERHKEDVAIAREAKYNVIAPYKGRTVDAAAKVKVYRNLHNGKFSVMQNGKVVGHSDAICLEGADLRVNQHGRDRVVASERKEVHAWAEGIMSGRKMPTDALPVIYNPYTTEHFMLGGTALYWTCHIWLAHGKMFTTKGLK